MISNVILVLLSITLFVIIIEKFRNELFNQFKEIMSNGTARAAPESKKRRKRRDGVGGEEGEASGAASLKSSPNKKKVSRRNKKDSPELRPRRRASQTYFFKYQLARNPLKAEEEDLKLALWASLQQCNGNPKTNGKTTNSKTSHNNNNNNNHSNDGNHHTNNNSNNLLHQHNNHASSKTHNHSKQPPDKKLSKSYSSHNHNHHNNHISSSATISAVTTAATTKPVADEEYLEKYRPETEDFLAFICFRSTAPNFQNSPNATTATTENATNISSSIGTNDTTTTTYSNATTNTMNSSTATSNWDGAKIDGIMDNVNSPNGNNNNISSATNINNNHNHIMNNNRRPTRQSPRLASSQRKISENDMMNTAYDNSINYEEDMKKASIALEDMAQEINSSDEISNRISRLSSSPYKNNKHLVKGLMTREFAGAFADEETIFESISNKL